MAHKLTSPHPALDLSFMDVRSSKQGGGLDFWTATPTGQYTADCEAGRALADEYLAYIGKHPTNFNATLLPAIVRDMVRMGVDGWSGLNVGFLGGVHDYAMGVARLLHGGPDAPDPAITAISAWRSAQAAVEAATGTPVETDEAAFSALCETAREAGNKAIETVPTSPAGRRAYAEFGRDFCRLYRRLGFSLDSEAAGDPSIPEELFTNLAASLGGGEA